MTCCKLSLQQSKSPVLPGMLRSAVHYLCTYPENHSQNSSLALALSLSLALALALALSLSLSPLSLRLLPTCAGKDTPSLPLFSLPLLPPSPPSLPTFFLCFCPPFRSKGPTRREAPRGVLQASQSVNLPLLRLPSCSVPLPVLSVVSFRLSGASPQHHKDQPKYTMQPSSP